MLHVTAFRTSQKISTEPTNDSNNTINPNMSKPPKEVFLIHNGFKKRIPPQSTKPIGSRMFTTHIVLKALKCRFRNAWNTTIKNQRNLVFTVNLKPILQKNAT